LNLSTRRAFIAAAVFVAAMLSATQARADQYASQQPGQLGLSVGASFVTASGAQHFGGTTQFMGGLSYTLSTTRGYYPSDTSLYFDYQTGSQGSGFVHSGGLGLQYHTRGQGYVGAAVGVYNTAVRSPNGELNANSTGGGGRVFVGYNLNRAAAVQLDYHFAPSALGVSPNGLGVGFLYRL
jgi:hypothetical protein